MNEIPLLSLQNLYLHIAKAMPPEAAVPHEGDGKAPSSRPEAAEQHLKQLVSILSAPLAAKYITQWMAPLQTDRFWKESEEAGQLPVVRGALPIKTPAKEPTETLVTQVRVALQMLKNLRPNLHPAPLQTALQQLRPLVDGLIEALTKRILQPCAETAEQGFPRPRTPNRPSSLQSEKVEGKRGELAALFTSKRGAVAAPSSKGAAPTQERRLEGATSSPPRTERHVNMVLQPQNQKVDEQVVPQERTVISAAPYYPGTPLASPRPRARKKKTPFFLSEREDEEEDTKHRSS